MRSEITFLENEMIELEGIFIDLSRLRRLVNQFYNLCMERTNENKSILNLFTARANFESCITIIKGMIEPSDSKLIILKNILITLCQFLI